MTVYSYNSVHWPGKGITQADCCCAIRGFSKVEECKLVALAAPE